jgi:hypothetical protein
MPTPNVLLKIEKKFEKIIIPQSLKVTISERDSESVKAKNRPSKTLPVEKPKLQTPDRLIIDQKGLTTFLREMKDENYTYENKNLGFSPDIKITTISAYKIIAVNLELISSEKLGEEKEMVSEQIISNKVETTNAGLTSNFTFTESISSENHWSSEVSIGQEIGLAIGTSVGVEINGAPLGLGATATANQSMEASISRSIERSFSQGKSESVEETYTIDTGCWTECPSGKTCKLTAYYSPVSSKYAVTTTLVRWNPEKDEPIKGTETDLKSTLTVKYSSSLRCENGIVLEKKD